MSSTDAGSSAPALQAFVAEAERIGQKLRSSRRPFFDAPSADATSYCSKRHRPPFSLALLESPACADAAELARKLDSMWAAGPAPELKALAPAAAALAEALRAAQRGKDADGDVTPFLYAMF